MTVSGARPSTSSGIFVTSPLRVRDIALSGWRLTPTGPATTASLRQSAEPCPIIALSQGATPLDPASANVAARVAKRSTSALT